MTENPHFESVDSWNAARALLAFDPVEPLHTAGFEVRSLQVHVRDHKLRGLPVEQRTLEAHYGGFVLSQSWRGADEAQRLALEVTYGPAPRAEGVAGRDACVYELGPEPAPDDVDERNPAVVAWHDGDMFYLIASGELPAEVLLRIATSLYE